MLHQKEDTINFLGSAAFILLFFLFVSAFSAKSVQQTHITFHHELVSELHSNPINAIIADAIPLPSFEISWVSLPDKMHFMLFNDKTQIFDNNNIVRRIIFLQKAALAIKPISAYRFYYHLFPKNSDEFPVLS